MEIIKWLVSPFNERIGKALIKVEPNEIADIDEMLAMIDGDSVGHFGLRVELISVGHEPKIKPAKNQERNIGLGYYDAEKQFGFPNYSSMKGKVRYYTAHVSRD